MGATSSGRNGAILLEDLAYELRLLVGADEIVSFIEAHDADRFGNLVNYFKDSAYLHARNLLNALTNKYVTEIGTIPFIRADVYGKVKDSLERYVMHVGRARNQRGVSNVREGKHLNEYVHDLTAEAKRCWNEWIDLTKDPVSQQKLRLLRDTSFSAAADDVMNLRQLVKGPA